MFRRAGMRGMRSLVCVGVFLAVVAALHAEVKLPAMFTSGMVLQRDMAVPVWGWAAPGEAVTVTIGGQSVKTEAAADGTWTVRLTPLALSKTPLTLSAVGGGNTVVATNVLVGDVWLCSGQSNMGMTVNRVKNADEEIAAADHPNIRLIAVPLIGTQERRTDFKGEWKPCSPQTVPHFSAAGYFFGRALHRELGVPIGLINCSWGGSACEAWVRRDLLEKNDAYKEMMDRWVKTETTWTEKKARAQLNEDLETWKQKAQQAKAEGKPAPRKPFFRNPLTGQHRPANLYNGMLTAVMPYALKGTIWYQGESNAGRAYQYRDLFPLMIRNWREEWKQGDFPFYWVQLANFMKRQDDPGAPSAWAELREAQTMTLKTVPNSGQAVIIDIGEANDIHPKNKQDVGERLADVALAGCYGKTGCYLSPMLKSAIINDDGSAIVTFEHVGQGLKTSDGGAAVKGFAVAGEDRVWHWAAAKVLDAARVHVTCPDVAKPVAVRYAWADNPEVNLYNSADLPACPFRTDDWPGTTFGKN